MPYLTVEPEFNRFVCVKCKAINHDAAFENGFSSDVKIRARGNIFISSDGFFCFDDTVRQIIETAKFKGIKFKKLVGTGWNVISLTCRVRADESVYEYSKQKCAACKRPREVLGFIRFPSQIKVPDFAGTFFTPKFDRGGKMNMDRDLFVTEDIALRFKKEGLKGGYFERLLSKDEEVNCRKAIATKQEFKWPKGTKILL